MKPVRASVVQAGPVAFDLDRTLEKTRSLVERAAKDADIVVFPEAYISGYPKGFDFGTKVGGRTPEGRVWYRRYFESAIDVPGPAVDALSAMAREHNVHLVIGVIERAIATLYCTVLFFAPNGEFLGKHRKVMPTAMERIIWGCGDGSTLPVYETAAGRIGAVICWENYMPLMRMAMYQKGIQLYCAPTVDDREVWQHTMHHIALEGRCFVLAACQYIDRGGFPQDYPGEATLIRGGSVIVGPLGKTLAGPLFDEEGILRAELNLDEILEGKFDLDVAGHYSRPDIFRFHVNEES